MMTMTNITQNTFQNEKDLNIDLRAGDVRY